jgi:hypothetical protein
MKDLELAMDDLENARIAYELVNAEKMRCYEALCAAREAEQRAKDHHNKARERVEELIISRVGHPHITSVPGIC